MIVSRPLPAPAVPPGYRRVEQQVTAAPEPRASAAMNAAGTVAHWITTASGRTWASIAVDHGLDLRRVDDEDDDVRAAGRQFGRVVDGFAAVGDEPVARGSGDVEADHPMAHADEVAGAGRAHGAQTDDADGEVHRDGLPTRPAGGPGAGRRVADPQQLADVPFDATGERREVVATLQRRDDAARRPSRRPAPRSAG